MFFFLFCFCCLWKKYVSFYVISYSIGFSLFSINIFTATHYFLHVTVAEILFAKGNLFYFFWYVAICRWSFYEFFSGFLYKKFLIFYWNRSSTITLHWAQKDDKSRVVVYVFFVYQMSHWHLQLQKKGAEIILLNWQNNIMWLF